jgi:hypothetical protein
MILSHQRRLERSDCWYPQLGHSALFPLVRDDWEIHFLSRSIGVFKPKHGCGVFVGNIAANARPLWIESEQQSCQPSYIVVDCY